MLLSTGGILFNEIVYLYNRAYNTDNMMRVGLKAEYTYKREQEWLLRDKYDGIISSEYKKDLARLAKGEPLAYVIGWVPFLGTKITLDERPLIPRVETEWWIERLISFLKQHYKNTSYTVLDMCAGSGAIGVAILSHCQTAHVTFVDNKSIYKETIQKNLIKNNISQLRAEICIGNLFNPINNKRFSVIVANPPYIPHTRNLPKSVIDYEPHSALYGGDDGLIYIRTIISEIPKHLTEKGVAFVEIDETHVNAVKLLSVHAGLQARILTDQYGRNRLIECKFR